jgi:hypothetical protein
MGAMEDAVEDGVGQGGITDGGRLLYEQAVQVLERVEETKAIARRVQEAGRQRFSFVFVPSTLYGYLPEVIRRYRCDQTARSHDVYDAGEIVGKHVQCHLGGYARQCLH